MYQNNLSIWQFFSLNRFLWERFFCAIKSKSPQQYKPSCVKIQLPKNKNIAFRQRPVWARKP